MKRGGLTLALIVALILYLPEMISIYSLLHFWAIWIYKLISAAVGKGCWPAHLGPPVPHLLATRAAPLEGGAHLRHHPRCDKALLSPKGFDGLLLWHV